MHTAPHSAPSNPMPPPLPGAPPSDPLAAARSRLEAQQTLTRSIEIRLDELRAELRTLQGLSAASLLAGLLGQRRAQVDAKQQAAAELEQLYAQHTALVATLEQEVAELARPTPEQQPAASPVTPPPLPAASPEATTLIEHIERARAAGEQALKDLHEETETLSMAGRVRALGGNRAIKFVMRAGRRHAANECAQRVGRSVARFGRLIDETLGGQTDIDTELLAVRHDLSRAAAEIGGTWLEGGSAAHPSCDWLIERLNLAGMLLERKLLDARSAR